jgi:Protein of Unknown function (DUF2784)
MLYARAADVVAATHGTFIAFLLVGGFLAWRWPRLVWTHVPAVVVTAAVFALGADCPLTDLEKQFRRQRVGGHTGTASSPTICCQWSPTALGPLPCPLLVVVVDAAAYAGYVAVRRRAGTGPRLTAAPGGRSAECEGAQHAGSLFPTGAVDAARGAHERRV